MWIAARSRPAATSSRKRIMAEATPRRRYPGKTATRPTYSPSGMDLNLAEAMASSPTKASTAPPARIAATTSSSDSECAPDSTASAPAYSANAWRIIERTSGASSIEASRTLTDTPVRLIEGYRLATNVVWENLSEKAVGDRPGPATRVDLLGLAPGSERNKG